MRERLLEDDRRDFFFLRTGRRLRDGPRRHPGGTSCARYQNPPYRPIGIGAGVGCDGKVMCARSPWPFANRFLPRFAKTLATCAGRVGSRDKFISAR